ncbi:MAG TPA: cobalamin-binding protein [Dehalococcoidia bacterium]|nr:cobalamin-binding protein [Dehalococcoidia bacterium]
MRICSLLPSATEIVCALGLEGSLVGVTHECDFPAAVRSLPRVTRSAIESDGLSSSRIDALVAARVHDHRGLYALDRDLLERLNPDLILTQELCDVCAVSYAEVQEAVRALFGERSVLSLEPTRLDEVFASIERVGTVTGRERDAAHLTGWLRAERDRIAGLLTGIAERPRVACIEWLDPPWVGGHWVPEMVALAGGTDALGEAGSPSVRTSWEQVAAARPNVIVVMPCGFGVERILREIATLDLPPTWHDLPAVRAGRVYAVDANSYFSRPGPRLVDGLRLLAGLLHAERLPLSADPNRWRAVEAG